MTILNEAIESLKRQIAERIDDDSSTPCLLSFERAQAVLIALAGPEQEPVAYLHTHIRGFAILHRTKKIGHVGPNYEREIFDDDKKAAAEYPDVHAFTPLYTSAPTPQPEQPVAINWTLNGDKRCGYDNWVGETPFGRILITWKSWKDFPNACVDEFPGGFQAYGDPEKVKEECEAEFRRRIGAQPTPRKPEQKVWCACGDSIEPDSGAKCGNCVAGDSAEPEQEPVEQALEALNKMQSILMMKDGKHPRDVLRAFIQQSAPAPQREHITDGSTCWCNPDVIEEDGGNVIVHNYDDNWQQYAKPGETAQQCIERHRAEQDALMKLYATPGKPVGQLQEEAYGRGQVVWFKKPADQSMLYTAPPQRKPVELTDGEIALLVGECAASAHRHDDLSFARSVIAAYEAKQGEQT